MSDIKKTEGKVPWEIFPFDEAEEVVRVFQHGMKPEVYGAPFTYRMKDIDVKLLAAATIRHAKAILNGHIVAEDSGCCHAGHIAANGLMIMSQYGRQDHNIKDEK